MNGPPDIKRLLTNPWVLGAALVAVVLGVIIWRKTNNAAGATQTQGTLQPGQTANAESADQFGLAVGQMQQELGNLVQQWSTGIASLQQPTPGSNATVWPGGYTAGGNTLDLPRAPVLAGPPMIFPAGHDTLYPGGVPRNPALSPMRAA